MFFRYRKPKITLQINILLN